MANAILHEISFAHLVQVSTDQWIAKDLVNIFGDQVRLCDDNAQPTGVPRLPWLETAGVLRVVPVSPYNLLLPYELVNCTQAFTAILQAWKVDHHEMTVRWVCVTWVKVFQGLEILSPCPGGRIACDQHQPALCFAEAGTGHAVPRRFERMSELRQGLEQFWINNRFPEIIQYCILNWRIQTM